MRLLSLALLASVLAIDMPGVCPELLPMLLDADFLSACAILLMYPSSSEHPSHHFYAGFVAALALLAGRLLSMDILLSLALMLAAIVVMYFVSGFVRFTGFSSFYRIVSAWKIIEDYSKLFYSLVWALMVVVLPMAGGKRIMEWLSAAVSLVLYAVLYVRAYFAVSALVPVKVDRAVRKMNNSALPIDVPHTQAEHSRMEMVFARVMEAMEDRQLFLRENLSLYDLSREVYCNKTYLSRAINIMSGMSFCKFVNSYRIPYAIELMKKDGRLKMKEIAMMSGFHNIVTFNVSFKELTGDTPTEYSQKLRLKPH